jgi:hypothetical protein
MPFSNLDHGQAKRVRVCERRYLINTLMRSCGIRVNDPAANLTTLGRHAKELLCLEDSRDAVVEKWQLRDQTLHAGRFEERVL